MRPLTPGGGSRWSQRAPVSCSIRPRLSLATPFSSTAWGGPTSKAAPLRSRPRARVYIHQSISRLLELPSRRLVLPGHVSEPTPFDGRLLATTSGEIRDNVTLAPLAEAEL